MIKNYLWYKDNKHSSIYQKPPVSKPISLYLFVLHSLFILLVEYYELEFLDAAYFPPLKIIEYNKEQHMKDYSG